MICTHMSNLPEVPEFCILLIILISVSAIKRINRKESENHKKRSKDDIEKQILFVDVEDLIK